MTQHFNSCFIVLNIVRTARADTPATHFLGVRLTQEETSLLEQFRTTNDLSNRSEAVRALVRAAAESRPADVGVPATLRNELEELVEDGYARDLDSAVTLLLTLGLGEVGRIHGERLAAMRDHARSSAGRRESRRRADREGRGLLGR
jgi:Arc/MetJ-type ribon-helix-helix transcriptional regulator